MVTPVCSKCRKAIPSDDINVAKDVAYCRFCNLSHPLSDLTRRAELEAGIHLDRPPAGAWYSSGGAGTVVGATHRSWGMALGALFFGLFWNGIVSVFVLLATASTLKLMHVPVPEWFPAPNMDGGPMGTGMTLFLWVFLTPFIAVGLMVMGAFLSAVAGRTEVKIANAEGTVFTGVGVFGYRRRFVRSEVKEVRIDDRQWHDSDGDRRRKTCILVETREGKQIKFGSMLTEDRRKFVAAALRRSL